MGLQRSQIGGMSVKMRKMIVTSEDSVDLRVTRRYSKSVYSFTLFIDPPALGLGNVYHWHIQYLFSIKSLSRDPPYFLGIYLALVSLF